MGRNQRHKKDIRADKAKVKLKLTKTKFLPKGQNVTNTSFKIKPIVLPEQLKDKSFDEVLSKQKLNIKDLLSQIKHYNEGIRNNACEKILDMLKTYTEEIVQQHLSQVILAISSLMQDKFHKVRSSAAKVVATILKHVPHEKLMPFFNIFSTNLRCAMTNIDRGVQEDSLLFLDTFVDSDCGLIEQVSEKLLPDFLSLISKLRSDSELGRTLTLNLGSKMTSVAWRIKVLSRLHSVLNIILKVNKKGENFACEEKVFKANTLRFPLYKEDVAVRLESASLDIFSTPEVEAAKGEDKVNRHIVTLVPLLYETWLEVIPEQKVQKVSLEDCSLSDEGASLLSCITDTLYLLWEYIKSIEDEHITLKGVFLCPEGQKFLTYLLKNFPYSYSGTRTKKTKLLSQNNDPKCVRENLLICFLFLTLQVNCTKNNIQKEANLIGQYVASKLSTRTALKGSSLNCFLELLRECFGANCGKWMKSGVDVRMFLEKSIFYYKNGKFINEEAKGRLFQILADVVDNGLLNRNPVYEEWLSTLPNLLCQPSISWRTIPVLLKLSKKNCPTFTKALLDKIPQILGNLENGEVLSEGEYKDMQGLERQLAGIFYYLPPNSEKDFCEIREFFNQSEKKRFRSHFNEILFLRNELRKF